LLLFVCSDKRAEQRVRAAVLANDAIQLPILLTTEWSGNGRAGSWRWASVRARDGESTGPLPTAEALFGVGQPDGK